MSLLAKHQLKWICISAHEKSMWVLCHERVVPSDLTYMQVLGRVMWMPQHLTWDAYLGSDCLGSFNIAIGKNAFMAARETVEEVYDEQVAVSDAILKEVLSDVG